MSKQDLNGVRTAQDLERKYDLASLLGLKKNIEIQAKNLIKINNELNNFITTTIGDIYDLQEQIDGKIETWYYDGEPTLSNQPAVNWTTDVLKNDHIGDLYYDRLTGYAYRFLFENDNYIWDRTGDSSIATALATANAAKDTADSKRQVFTQQPTVPYDNGDLWITSNEIFICQVSRHSGNFNSNDWNNDLKYTDDTVAEAIVDELGGTTTTVLHGQVVTQMAEYTKFTDLATGGSTTIAGENITTGKIKSQNYVANTSGMQIDLSNGKIDTKNTKWDEYGNIILSNGAQVVNDKGILTNLQFQGVGYRGGIANKIGWNFVGFTNTYALSETSKDFMEFLADIPSDFTILSAYVTVLHQPVYYSNIPDYGYSRALGLYQASNDSYVTAEINSEYKETVSSTTEISSAFGSASGWTPSTPSSSSRKIEQKNSIDISDKLAVGSLNRIIIQSRNSPPAYSSTSAQECAIRTGRLKAVLNVYGYMKT